MITIIIDNCLIISIMSVILEKKSKQIINNPTKQDNLNLCFLGLNITMSKKMVCTITWYPHVLVKISRRLSSSEDT